MVYLQDIVFNRTAGCLDDFSVSTAARMRRSTIPEKPNYRLSLWSVVKNCIGKELSKIPMPVRHDFHYLVTCGRTGSSKLDKGFQQKIILIYHDKYQIL